MFTMSKRKKKLTFNKKVNFESKGFHTPEKEELFLALVKAPWTKDLKMTIYIPMSLTFKFPGLKNKGIKNP